MKTWILKGKYIPNCSDYLSFKSIYKSHYINFTDNIKKNIMANISTSNIRFQANNNIKRVYSNIKYSKSFTEKHNHNNNSKSVSPNNDIRIIRDIYNNIKIQINDNLIKASNIKCIRANDYDVTELPLLSDLIELYQKNITGYSITENIQKQITTDNEGNLENDSMKDYYVTELTQLDFNKLCLNSLNEEINYVNHALNNSNNDQININTKNILVINNYSINDLVSMIILPEGKYLFFKNKNTNQNNVFISNDKTIIEAEINNPTQDEINNLKQANIIIPEVNSLNELIDNNNNDDDAHLKFNKYSGELLNGIMHGKGVYYYSNGCVYEGDFENGSNSGFGIFYFPNGTFYQGDFKNGIFEGKGEYYFNNSDIYKGDFNDGLMQGNGVYFTNGEIYEGGFKDDMFDGEGIYVTNNLVIKGKFKENYLLGKCLVGYNKSISKENDDNSYNDNEESDNIISKMELDFLPEYVNGFIYINKTLLDNNKVFSKKNVEREDILYMEYNSISHQMKIKKENKTAKTILSINIKELEDSSDINKEELLIYERNDSRIKSTYNAGNDDDTTIKADFILSMESYIKSNVVNIHLINIFTKIIESTVKSNIIN